MPNLYQTPANCRAMRYHTVDRYGRPLPIQLRDLPKAGAQLLVDRRIGGCRVITLMGRGAAPAPDQPNPPASQYRLMPLKPTPPR
jgi:hypothetical protein